MREEEIRAIALFFFFALTDSIRGQAATVDTIAKFREHVRHAGDTPRLELLVATIEDQWNRVRRSLKKQTGEPVILPSEFSVPVDLSHWREFQKHATPEELAAAIYSGILRFDDKTIAHGLMLPEGTIRYRLSKAYSKIGTALSRTRAAGVRA